MALAGFSSRTRLIDRFYFWSIFFFLARHRKQLGVKSFLFFLFVVGPSSAHFPKGAVENCYVIWRKEQKQKTRKAVSGEPGTIEMHAPSVRFPFSALSDDDKLLIDNTQAHTLALNGAWKRKKVIEIHAASPLTQFLFLPGKTKKKNKEKVRRHFFCRRKMPQKCRTCSPYLYAVEFSG